MTAPDLRRGRARCPSTASSPWGLLRALPAWQITQIPRTEPTGENRRDATAQRLQAFVPAYCRAAPVAVAWIREQAGGPVRVLAAGAELVGGRDRGQAVLTVPAGARGSPLGPGEAVGLLAALPCWTPLAGISDVLLAEDGTNGAVRDREAAPSLEDGLLSAWLGPFGWLLLAART